MSKYLLLVLLLLSSCFKDGELTYNYKSGHFVSFHSPGELWGSDPGQVIDGVYVRTLKDGRIVVYAWGYMWRVDRDSVIYGYK